MTKTTLVRLPDWVCEAVEKYAEERGVAFATAVRLVVVEHFKDAVPAKVPGQAEKEKPGTSKRKPGRPPKTSEKPCGTCGHFEDIHSPSEGPDRWTGPCDRVGCNCTEFNPVLKIQRSPGNPPCANCGHPESNHDSVTGFCTLCRCNAMIYHAQALEDRNGLPSSINSNTFQPVPSTDPAHLDSIAV